MSRDDADDLTVFARELASRLRVFKLLMLDRGGGLIDKDGNRLSFVEEQRIGRTMRNLRSRARRAIVRAALDALEDGVGSVNLVAPGDVYEELFSFIGAGTLFTEMQYGFVRPVSIDDFEEVEALIVRGQTEGLPAAAHARSDRADPAVVLRLPNRRRTPRRNLLAADRALPPRPRRRDHRDVHADALPGRGRRRRAGPRDHQGGAARAACKYVFACTSDDRVAGFFARLGFKRVECPRRVRRPSGAATTPRVSSSLSIFRTDLD